MRLNYTIAQGIIQNLGVPVGEFDCLVKIALDYRLDPGNFVVPAKDVKLSWRGEGGEVFVELAVG